MLGLGKIGSIILAAVVVGVVLSVFYPPLIKEFKEIGAYVASGGKANLTGFKPYDPALRLSAEEHRTDDSMKALQCAIESAKDGAIRDRTVARDHQRHVIRGCVVLQGYLRFAECKSGEHL